MHPDELFPPGQPVVIAYGGGRDSTAERPPDVLGSRAREMCAAYERQRAAMPAVTASA